MAKVTGFISKELTKQVQALYKRGGNFQKAAEKVKALLYDIKSDSTSVVKILSCLPKTNHGETRIQHCVKYDLPGFCRLITLQDNGWIILLYVGDHDECHIWLNKNKGLQIAVEDIEKGLYELYVSESIETIESRIDPESDFSDGKLFEKLKFYYKDLAVNLPPFFTKHLEGKRFFLHEFIRTQT